ncbi:hypothetical protein LXA43DRAFT_1065559 [Ganoderma leucocontextum]|nr:hypothetical protein LXA43DRAFT_1065559 [Ganoderma leucocontextum]
MSTGDASSSQAIQNDLALMEKAVTYFKPLILPFEELSFYHYGITPAVPENLGPAAGKYTGDMISESFILANVEHVGLELIMRSTSIFLDVWKSQPSRTPPTVIYNLHPGSPHWLG